MSHHFDTPTARQDPRINVCDLYLFPGAPGATVMAMTVNPDAGVSAPTTFREEAIYAFRFDLDGDCREDVAFKVRFGAPVHADGDEHAHVQTFEVRKAIGDAAQRGPDGELMLEGRLGATVATASGCLGFAGLAPDLFAGDSGALGHFRNALFKDNKLAAEAFLSRHNFFAKRNVCAIVIEVPNAMIGNGLVRGWATASLHGHAPEVQVSRWGFPLLTNLFMPDLAMREDFNRAAPGDDVARFSAQVGSVAAQATGLAGSAANPGEYGQALAARILPAVLPYRLGSPAMFGFGGINGRSLTDDVMDVVLTWTTNTALGDGVAPDRDRMRPGFPYFGEPYTAAEQTDVVPAHQPAARA